MSDNPYLDALNAPSPDEARLKENAVPQGESLPQAPKAAAVENPYLAALDNVEATQRTQLQATLRTAAPVNPDQAAKAKKLSSQTGIPQDVVVRNLMDVEVQAAVDQADKRLATAPFTAERMRQLPFAEMAHDDVDSLTTLERIQKEGWWGVRTLAAGVGPALASGFYGAAETAVSFLAPLGDPLAGTILPENPLRRVAAGLSEVRKNQQRITEETAGEIKPEDGVIRRGIRSGILSVGQQAPGIAAAVATGNPSFALGSAGVTAFGTSAPKALDAGMSPTGAIAYGASDAAIEIATERLPIAKLMGDMKAGSGFFKTLAHQIAAEVPGEQIATVLQDFNEWAALNPEKPFSKYIAERPAAAAETLVATMVGVGINSGAVAAVNKVAGNEQKAQAAESNAANLERILKTSADSKLRERDPEGFAQFVQQAAEQSGSEVTDVYIDAETFAQSLAENEDAQAILQRMPTVAAQLDEAIASGGDLRIPIGELASAIPGTGLEQVFLQNSRTDPESLSLKESASIKDGAQAELEAQAQDVLTGAEQTAETANAAQNIRQGIFDQLKQAGRFTDDVNAAYAEGATAFYTTQAERLGITPEEMFQRYPLRIQAEDVVGGALDQPAFHGSAVRGIEQFTTQKMGTGEGAQAFGWGMYFAESKDIAEFYRKTLAGDGFLTGDGKIFKPSTLEHMNVRALANRGDIAGAIAKAEQIAASDSPVAEMAKRDAATLRAIEASGGLKPNPGQTYQVEVPEDGDLLDYDVAFKDQPPKVQLALGKVGISPTEVEVRLDNGRVQMFDTMDQARRAIKANNWDAKPKTVPNTMTGKQIYAYLESRQDLPGVENSADMAADEAASRALFAAGIPGLRFLDAGSRGAQAKGKTRNYVIFDDSAVQKTGEFYQAQGTRRGAFSPSTATITMLARADLSTFNHESAHFYLEVLSDMASKPDAPPQIQEDMSKLLKWFGVPDLATWQGMTLDEQRASHEKFAEGYEQYLFEGRAPSRALLPIFQRFRSWMVSVYKSLSIFAAGRNIQLNDEVRAVYDRLIATDQQIAEAEQMRGWTPLFESAEAAGMSEDQFKAYLQDNREVSQDALDEMQGRSLRDMKWLGNARSRALKALQRDAKDKRSAVKEEVTAEVDQLPEIQAMRALDALQVTPDYAAALSQWKEQRNTQLDEARKNATADLVASEGSGLKGIKKGQFLAKNKRRIENTAEAAVLEWERDNPRPRKEQSASEEDLIVISESFGFSSPDEMLQKIQALGTKTDLIEAMTDQRMLERYGDLTDPVAMERAVNESIYNEARVKFVATELSSLNKAMGNARVLMAAAKQFAEQIISRKKIIDIKPNQFSAAEARAGKAAEKALAKGEQAEAVKFKRAQLLNTQAAKAAYAAQEEVAKGLKYLKKFDSDGVRKGLDADYTDQIDMLLERYDLRVSTSARDIQRRKSLTQWIAAQQDMGLEPDVPDAILNETAQISYKEMPLEDFRGLVDTIKQIEHLGRLKHRLLTAQDKRNFDDIRDSIVSGIIENGKGRTADTRTSNTLPGQALEKMKNFWASHIKAATWARIMDGGKDGGPVWEYLIRAANMSGDRETAMREKATKDLSKILGPVLSESKMGGKGQYFPSINRSMNLEARMAVALNVGNASNLQRLLGGEGWTADQIQPVLDSLTEKQWKAVQEVWDYFESYRPEIAAKERRVYGKEPDWIEPTPVRTKFGELKGGYLPIKFDPRASDRAEQHADAEDAKRQMQGAYTSATTRRSFTKSRVDEVHGRPLLYSLDSIYNGVQEVIHDLSWHEFLIDANRLVKNQAISRAMRETYGPEVHQQFKRWLEDVAVGEQQARAAGEQALAWIRQGVSISGLGFNVMSAAMQPLGLTQSIVRIGPQWVGRGIAKAISSPVETTAEISEKSTFMRTRFLTRFRELNELRNQVKGQTKTRAAIDAGAYALMLRAQQLVDIPTWWGAYEKAIAEGNDDARSVALADQAVIDSQGGGSTKDQSGIERGTPAVKLFGVFYSFFNTALNLGVQQTMTQESKAKLAANYLLLYVAPAVLGVALKDALTPGDSGEWDDGEKIARRLLAEQLGYLFGLIFGVREVGGFIKANVAGEKFGTDYTGPAGVRMIQDLSKFTKEASQGEADNGLRKAIVNLAGSLMRLPSAQINRTITGAQAINEGKTKNPAALLTGYQEPR